MIVRPVLFEHTSFQYATRRPRYIHALILRDIPAHQNSSPAWNRFQRCQQFRCCYCRRAPRPAPHFNVISELSAIIFSERQLLVRKIKPWKHIKHRWSVWRDSFFCFVFLLYSTLANGNMLTAAGAAMSCGYTTLWEIYVQRSTAAEWCCGGLQQRLCTLCAEIFYTQRRVDVESVVGVFEQRRGQKKNSFS